MSEDLSTPNTCCVRNFFTPGDHSGHCAKNTQKHKPSTMHHDQPPPTEDPGQGEGCEGGKCERK